MESGFSPLPRTPPLPRFSTTPPPLFSLESAKKRGVHGRVGEWSTITANYRNYLENSL